MSALLAQLRTELTLTLRNKESLLLTIGIPIGLLVFFSLVNVLPLDVLLGPGDEPVDVLAPGVLALAIMSMAMTGLAIATGFVYVAVILDAWSRRVVGYAIGRSLDARHAVAALRRPVGSWLLSARRRPVRVEGAPAPSRLALPPRPRPPPF